MYPIVFSYKILTIGGYGIVLGLAFYIGFMLGEREFKLRGKDPELAYKLLITAIPSAIIGAKIFHIFENFSIFLKDPSGMIFSGAGLSVQGGYIVALIVCIIVIQRNRENVLEIFDLSSPTLAFGYGIGRIACHVSGDGCYGITTSSFLGTPYPNGIVPTSAMVLPTPLFESFFSLLGVVLLVQLRKRELATGKIFFIYLMLNGIPRFLIEFIRLNPKEYLSMSQAQLVAILFIITGIIGYILVDRKSRSEA